MTIILSFRDVRSRERTRAHTHDTMPPGPFASPFLEKGAVLPRGAGKPGGGVAGGAAAAAGGHTAKHKRKARGEEIVFDPDACR